MTTKKNNFYGRVLIYLALFLSCSFVFTQQRDKENIDELLNNLFKAFEQQDIKLHQEIWSQSDELRIIGVFENSNFCGWSEFKVHLNKTLKTAKNIKLTEYERKTGISRDGKTGWFYMLVDEIIELPAKRVKLAKMRYTGVVRKEISGWKIIQFHGSVPEYMK
ncbi:nuclear transport factor 2 family protein [Bacteroidota bacterium]